MKVKRVVVLGSGNIGSDLCERLILNENFHLVALVGRSKTSSGLARFRDRIENVLDSGLNQLLNREIQFDGCFDATSADDHLSHWARLKELGKWVIDLTPSNVGLKHIPAIKVYSSDKLDESAKALNFSMVSCGGQSGGPLAYALSKAFTNVVGIEVSSSIAAKSAGPATRKNINNYIETTEQAISEFTNCTNVKVILVLNPASPPVEMRTTVSISGENMSLQIADKLAREMEIEVQGYVPGYRLVVPPHPISSNTLTATVRVTGLGLFLPSYAGNLDIINAAAIKTAEQHALRLEVN